MAAYPSLLVQPPQQQDILGQAARLMQVRNALQQQQFQQQLQPLQIQQAQQQVEQQRRQMASQQALTQAYIDANGDLDQTMANARRSGVVLPDDLVNLQQHILTVKDKLASMTKTDLENIATQNNNLRGLFDPVAAETDPTKQAQLYANAKQTILSDPQAATKYGITNPAQLPDYQNPQHVQFFDAGLKGGKQQVEDELKAAQTYEATERGKQLQQQQAMGGTPEMQDVRYTNLAAKQAQGQPLSADEQAFMQGYQQRKTISAQFRVENRQGPQGTWQLAEDPKTGEPLQYNTVTGETRPANIARTGTFQKTVAPAQDALNYAQNYGASKTYTGPGDEALLEKFFELAKPSSGFRMSQPQIDMLKNAQDWMGSAEAKIRHATTGTWFSDTQRQQIISTMGALATAKGISAGGGNGAPAPGAGATGSWGDQFGVKPR